MHRIRARRGAVLAVLGLAVFVSSCTQPVPGAPLTSDEGVRKAMEQRFHAIIGKLDRDLVSTRDAKATETWNVAVNNVKATSKMTYAYRGDPATTLIHRNPDRPAASVIIYHPAGGDSNYFFLGKRYRSLAPTPWVAVPTSLDPELTDTCLLPGKISLCELGTALEKALENTPDAISKIAYTNPDGSTSLLTNLSVEQFIDSDIIQFQHDIKSKLPKPILEKLLSVRLDLDHQDRVKSVHIAGSISRAGKKFSIKGSHKILGKTRESDFPTIPPDAELTKINDKAKVEEFRHRATGEPPQ